MLSSATRTEGPFRDSADNDNVSFYDYPSPSSPLENPFADASEIDDTAALTREEIGRKSGVATRHRAANSLPGPAVLTGATMSEGDTRNRSNSLPSKQHRWSKKQDRPEFNESSRRRSKLAIQALSRQFLTKLKPSRDGDSDMSDPAQSAGRRVMGVPLEVSIQYAYVELDLEDGKGSSLSDGRIPIVVGSCAEYLKKTGFTAFTSFDPKKNVLAQDPLLEQLEQEFENPDSGYGLDLNWEQQRFSDHQAASLLLRYLLRLPNTVIPSSSCPAFREAYLTHCGRSSSGKPQEFDVEGLFSAYYTLIDNLPLPNRNLLFYMLDLLAAAVARHGTNMLKTVVKIFCKAIIRSPKSTSMSKDKGLNDAILIFLIRHQPKLVQKRRRAQLGYYPAK